MLRSTAPKNARSKRALDARKPQVVENPKTSILLRSSTSSAQTTEALKDLHALRKPHSVLFSKKNQMRPFDDPRPLEFLAAKNDASLFVAGSHSKKHPHSLQFARMFNHELYDLCEFGLEAYVSMSSIRGPQCAPGNAPLMLFSGMAFETSPVLQQVRLLLLDFFGGRPDMGAVHLGGLDHVIHIAVDPAVDPHTSEHPRLLLRCYAVELRRAADGGRAPRVELVEMGPRMDLAVRRHRWASDELRRAAHRVPKVVQPTKVKNVTKDILGDAVGRVHVGRQDLGKLQTRKMKGLKRSRDLSDSGDSDGSVEADGSDGSGSDSDATA